MTAQVDVFGDNSQAPTQGINDETVDGAMACGAAGRRGGHADTAAVDMPTRRWAGGRGNRSESDSCAHGAGAGVLAHAQWAGAALRVSLQQGGCTGTGALLLHATARPSSCTLWRARPVLAQC